MSCRASVEGSSARLGGCEPASGKSPRRSAPRRPAPGPDPGRHAGRHAQHEVVARAAPISAGPWRACVDDGQVREEAAPFASGKNRRARSPADVRRVRRRSSAASRRRACRANRRSARRGRPQSDRVGGRRPRPSSAASAPTRGPPPERRRRQGPWDEVGSARSGTRRPGCAPRGLDRPAGSVRPCSGPRSRGAASRPARVVVRAAGNATWRSYSPGARSWRVGTPSASATRCSTPCRCPSRAR